NQRVLGGPLLPNAKPPYQAPPPQQQQQPQPPLPPTPCYHPHHPQQQPPTTIITSTPPHVHVLISPTTLPPPRHNNIITTHTRPLPPSVPHIYMPLPRLSHPTQTPPRVPASMTSSFTSNTSDAASGVSMSSGCVVEKSCGVERGIQSSLPSLTYEAIRALGEDIQAFRHTQQITDDESVKSAGGRGGGSNSEAGGTISSQVPPTFEPPGPPSTAPPHSTSSNPLVPPPTPPIGPQAGTLAPGGSLPPLEIGVAPLEEAESDCLEDHVIGQAVLPARL
ncbi:hypothetical protein Pmani_013705, partial [Petrolisthes manimaculis]